MTAETDPLDLESPSPLPDVPDTSAEPFAWSLRAAVLVVASTLATTLVAGVVSGLVMLAPWPDSVKAAGVGIALGLAYAAQVGLVRLLARRKGSSLSDAVELRPIADPLRAIVAALFAMVIARIGAVVFAVLLERMHVSVQGQNLDPTKVLPQGPVGMAGTIVLVCVLAPIAEEVVFRGVLLGALRARWGVSAGIIGSAAVFALFHVSLYALVPIGFFGLILAWLYVKTENLAVPILAHALFNAVGLIGLYALKAGGAL